MKKLYTIASLLLVAAVTHAQSVFFEDFENGLTSQLTQSYVVGTTDWSTDAVGLGGADVAFAGDSAAHFYAPAYNDNVTVLETPNLDLSTGGYKLSFWHVQPAWGADQNTLSIYLSVDGGTTWQILDSIETNIPSYQEAVYNLNDFATTTATTKIKFSGYNTYGYAVGVDNIDVFLPLTDDVVAEDGIVASGCGLGLETVSLIVTNNGLNTITSLEAGFEVNVQSESEVFSVNIAPGETDTLDFTTPADLSTLGVHNFSSWTALVGDGDLTNDTVWFSTENIPVVASLPYTQDFESGAGGWATGGSLSSWELGLPNNTFIDTANSGVNAWVTNLDGDYNNNEQSYVESPCFDFSSLNIDPVFRFSFLSETEADWDGTFVQLSTDGGATWTTVGNVGEGTNWYNNDVFYNSNIAQGWDGLIGTSAQWLTATHILDGAAGISSVKVRVSFISDDWANSEFEGFAFDDVEIFEQPPINAGITEILSPLSGCGLGMEAVTVVVENFGDADLVDYLIEYNIGTGAVSELQTDTLFIAEVDTITFSTMADLSALGLFDISAWTSVTGDGDATDDTSFVSVNNSPVVSSFPYIEDFETGANGWYSEGTNGTWELGDPEGTYIDTANSGINAWATNLDSLVYEDNQLSYLTSPCFDFSGLAIDPIVEFALISLSEINYDGAWLEVSTDAGATWRTNGNVGEGTNWYNNEDEHGVNFDLDWWDGTTADTSWVISEHLLDSVAGYSDVIIRFVFDSDGSNFFDYEGFAIDDISIREQPAINSEVTAITSPVSGCGLTATETIMVQVTNLGSTVMDSVIIGFSVDNGTPVTEVFNNSIAIGGDSTFTLTQTIDLSAFADYEISVWTGTIDDGDTSNDTAMVTVTSVPTISTLPYVQDFETGTNGWTAGGTNSTWEFGDPETTFIDTANSGVNAWVTNLAGDYNNSEDSYIESPCMDFSSLSADPVLKFAGIFRTEACCDEGWVDISLDGGATWAKLGVAGEGSNWYNDAVDDFWNGTSGLANEWLTAEHLLDGAAGQSNVKIRFMFSSDFSAVDDGFGLDDISITEQPQLDFEMISVDAPSSGCNLGEEAITFTFWNKGLSDVTGFDYGFRVDGGIAQTESSTATVASGDTVTITTSTELADLSATSVYTIDVFTALAGDEIMSNDTLFDTVIENLGTATPLSQTVEPVAELNSTISEGTTSQMFFCGLPNSLDGCLEIENLTIDSIGHTFLADLDIYLISPAGDTLELSTDNGGSGDDMVNVVFSDTSSNYISTQTSGIPSDIYHTEDSLGFAAFYDGQDPNGAWSLWITDDAGGDNGELVSWSMTFADNSPTPVLDYTDTTICVYGTLELMSDPYDSYLWSTGHNTQSIELFGNVLGLGTTEVSVTVDQDGCTGVSNSFILTVDACAGVAELGALNIDIYPNPSNGQIVVDIAGETEGLNVSILDINGKLVQSELIGKVTTGVRKAIDLTNVAKGMYFIKLDDGKDAVTQKLIIQ